MKKWLLVFLCVCLTASSCRYFNSRKKAQPDKSITPVTSYNNLFLDSSTIANFLNQHPNLNQYSEQFFEFYQNRNYQFAWFDSAAIGEQAHNFVNLVDNTIAELHDSSLYNATLNQLLAQIAETDGSTNHKSTIVTTELLLTGQFFTYAAKIYKGSDIDVTELGWFIPRKKINLAALLDSTLTTKAKEPEQFVPLNSQYKKLQTCLLRYYEWQKRSTSKNDTLAIGAKPYRLGQNLPVIAQLKKQLFVLGDLNQNDTTQLFDTTLLRAVKQFQRRMGLSITGSVGSKMIDELNDSTEVRIRQILVNMERIRWMPPQTDSAYIMVNIPEYKLHVYDSGKWAFDMNVIVGSAINNTVIFSGKLRYIVFSPYWNIPPSIVEKEILPAIKNNPNYLSKHHMEIYGKKGALPDIRQKPGPDNSLGLVKFLFPNNYNIYLHDTPNRDLFTSKDRSLSHGCIRISDPPKMAAFLLKSDTSFTAQKIDSLMHLPKEKWVTLEKPMRVYIGYFTAWVDENGLLNCRKDIYGHDKKVADKLFVSK